MTKLYFYSAILASLSFLFLTTALPHGDLHDQIQGVTSVIQHATPTAELYVKRGELYRLHGDFQAALEDYDRALALDQSFPNIEYLRGRVFFEMKNYEKAKPLLDQFLSTNPKHFQARLTRARTLRKLGLAEQAISDFTILIDRSPRPEVECFIELAQAYAASGTNGVQQAIKSLDNGIEKLGSTVSLQLAAIDLELQIKNYDGALNRVDIISASLSRKENWLARRVEILEMANRLPEAQKAAQDALAEIQTLPPHLRNTKSVQELKQRLQEKAISLTQFHPSPQ